MKYELTNSNSNYLDLLIKYKLSTILDYANNISKAEKNKIINYVNEHVREDINIYKLICVDNNIIGCILTKEYDDGVIIDELYLEDEFRGKGIGTSIIKQLEKDNSIIYLWVYKDNVNAINLYEKLGFKIIENTESRYKMKFTI